jgi:hypothetical protein
LDGTTVGNPSRTYLTYFDPAWHRTSAAFVFTGVAPGKHTLSIQLASYSDGHVVEIDQGTLVVGFK